MKYIIENAVIFAETHHKKPDSSHDWWHVKRVWQMAKKIAISENANLPIVELAAASM